jgi:hypothetical protein
MSVGARALFDLVAPMPLAPRTDPTNPYGEKIETLPK